VSGAGCTVSFAQALLSRSLQGGRQEVLQPEAEQLLALANRSRAEQGAAPLKWDAALARAARSIACAWPPKGRFPIAMKGNRMSRSVPAGGSALQPDRGERGDCPDADAIHDEWMHSPVIAPTC